MAFIQKYTQFCLSFGSEDTRLTHKDTHMLSLKKLFPFCPDNILHPNNTHKNIYRFGLISFAFYHNVYIYIRKHNEYPLDICNELTYKMNYSVFCAL